MIESPILREIVAEHAHKFVLSTLTARFGSIPQDVRESIQAIDDDDRLEALNVAAVHSPDLDAFRRELVAVPPGE